MLNNSIFQIYHIVRRINYKMRGCGSKGYLSKPIKFKPKLLSIKKPANLKAKLLIEPKNKLDYIITCFS